MFPFVVPSLLSKSGSDANDHLERKPDEIERSFAEREEDGSRNQHKTASRSSSYGDDSSCYSPELDGTDGESSLSHSLLSSSYQERRERNNEAARRSRARKRFHEEILVHKATALEQENIKLRTEVDLLRKEVTKTQLMLYQRNFMA